MNFFINYMNKIILTILIISLLFVFNIVTVKHEAYAITKTNKQIVEVFKTPSCGCCYGYVLFLKMKNMKSKKQI